MVLRLDGLLDGTGPRRCQLQTDFRQSPERGSVGSSPCTSPFGPEPPRPFRPGRSSRARSIQLEPDPVRGAFPAAVVLSGEATGNDSGATPMLARSAWISISSSPARI